MLCTLAGVFPRALGSVAGTVAGGEDSALHSAGSNSMLLFFNAVAVALTGLRAYRYLPEMLRMLRQARALTVAYLLVAISPLWAATPGVAFRSATYVEIYLFAAMYFALTMPPEEVYRNLAHATAVLAAMSVVGQFTFPPSGDLAPGWNGVFFQKNELGIMMAMGLLAQIVWGARWTVLRVAECLLCATLLILSESVTSLGCLVVASASLLFLRLRKNQRMLMLASLLFFTVVVAVFVPNAPSLVLAANGRDASFTGRDIVWAYALKSILAHPFLGYGYQDFWSEVAGSTGLAFGFTPQNSENGLLQIALFTGIPGLLASVLFCVRSWQLSARARRLGDGLPGRGLFVLNLVMLVRSISEPAFVEQNLMWWVLMVAYMTAFVARRRARAALLLERAMVTA